MLYKLIIVSALCAMCSSCISVDSSRLRIGILNDEVEGEGLDSVKQEETLGLVIRWKR